MGYVIINEKDNVKVNFSDGHKYARCSIPKGEKIIKYGFPIGTATQDIKENEFVHTHNLKTNLRGINQYSYKRDIMNSNKERPVKIHGYIRYNGDIGIRNNIYVIPTVGCVNSVVEKIAEITKTIPVTHPYGCSQLNSDLLTTQKFLAGIIKNPNTGGALVVGLGCENNNIEEFKKILGEYDIKRVEFLNLQDCDDEIRSGIEAVEKLRKITLSDKKILTDISNIKIGLKCGGSDGLSGITANPLCGKISDRIISMGGSAVLTEVPEMFGAETILMSRCIDENVFKKAEGLINNFKNYFIKHNEPISENPSPGNKKGGITTLEEKSLGCVQKGGSSYITDVLDYGDIVKEKGLNLLNGPGNDIVSTTNLVVAGCQIILFTTGRGTPLGSLVPTVKISTSTKLFNSKRNWIDYDAQSGNEETLFSMIIDIINGEKTCNEKNNYYEAAIFKDGITL